MIPTTVQDIARICRGDLAGIGPGEAAALVVDGPVVTDSREATTGSLFIARVGEATDGHRFVAAARAAGAVAAVTTRPVDGVPCIVVDDVQDAFARLARDMIERRPDLVVVGITGSSGKTTTKDLLGSVLATAGETIAPVGSYNTEVGVPLTVTRVTPTTRFLVVEMGARGTGHIAYLTSMAPPRIGAVLNVGSAHIGEFGSRDAIAIAKRELIEALPADGVAVLNADDARVRAMASRSAARIVLTSAAGRHDADVRAERIELDDIGRPRFELVMSDEGSETTVPVSLRLHGTHHVANALTVAAIARECGMTPAEIGSALTAAEAVSRWRMEFTERPDGVTVVNDAYNANPESMTAALSALATMRVTGRRIAVLGPMLELGAASARAHTDLGELAAHSGVDVLVVVGDEALPIVEGAAGEGLEATAVADTDTAYELVTKDLRPGDVVLLKSSNAAGLRWLGDRLAGRTEDER